MSSTEEPPPGPAPNKLLIVNRALSVPIEELQWRFSASGGPGGQHANTSNTRVECLYDIAASPSLTEWQRARLLERCGPVLRVVAADERSQLRNRELAMERLRDRLRAALHERPRRVATKPTRSSKERRLHTKRLRAGTKRMRRIDGSAD